MTALQGRTVTVGKTGMTVTDITEISKTRAKVCVDTDEAFALYKSELGKFHIKKDEELPEELYRHIMEELLRKRAKLRCMNLLKGRDYTECQLRMKLRQGFYPGTIIDEAVAYAASFGYVDDVRYARMYIGQAAGTKSRKQIESRLLEKGISKENMEQAYEQCETEEELAGEGEVIAKLLAKKHYDGQNATYEERRKMFAFLYRRGFSPDEIYRAVEI